ncbi:amidohydrolase [Paenibacillus melissococcoides]|uniref:5-methylthioadenosine/S-adenosylhomocysteine deaminase n=1 Tax=Paenibacillus melissococcoides TaxID=2912268 RepID=A0ABM9G4S1_9BACL|nr:MULTISPECIES: amidohydrolase [Paenibacillus]MEB9894530.1 amidohydrolase [Bacillus cereus]CAH8246642.1 amidohydrolase [Paenibacillus melissococcoides]CAH8715336.1 amidohydrolase [Paenibacillus melissococcoides]CAH8716279.1 amidohydrolase [Paenibacillus melissococcoides]GIO80017.1 5-methylthioadenosine/S-adenosylhomocysteine deaminase [Paenibacillus dendritiformis]
MNTLIKNVIIVTMKEGDVPFHGDILIAGDTIQQIGPALDVEADEVIEGEDMVAMPGLINAHQHTPMSLLRGFSDDLKLMDWLERKMLPAEANMTPEDIYWGAKLSMAEMIKSGTTAFADMYIHMDEVAAAVDEVGMRASLSRGMVFLQDDGGQRLTEALGLIERWNGKAGGRITTMLAPHAPYTCPPEPLKHIVRLAESMRLPIHIHLAETPEEVMSIREKYNETPAQYLYNIGLFEKAHVLLAHGVHMTRGDIGLLRGMRGGVAHNPVSNLKLGCGIAPVADMMNQGIVVGLGTDGAGSAATVDMFEEIKAAAWLQKLDYGDPTVLPAGQALRMATRESAKLLNIDREAGTLEAGKLADLILVDMNKPHLQPIHQIESLLAYSANGADVDTTIVNGKVLMRHRQLVTIDEDEVLRQASIRAKRIVAGI